MHTPVFTRICLAAVLLCAGGPAAAQLVDPIGDLVDVPIVEQVEDALRDTLEATASAADEALALVEEIVPDGSEPFVAAVDEDGHEIESGVVVLLARADRLRRIDRLGLVVRERRRLEAVDLVLLRVELPPEPRRRRALERLARRDAGIEIDRNHLYREQRRAASGSRARSAAAGSVAGLAIGIVDSAVATGHEALAGADIEQRDFVSFAHPRPTAHGTAVASLLVGDSPAVRGGARGARLHAASVFFERPDGENAATTAALVQALDWLAGGGVRVVNMSLSGPPNRILEAAVERVADRGIVIVAAVGNAGPAAPPLYPAGYPAVVGITALDAQDRVYRYANRGRQVAFAAPGVDVPVAVSAGGHAPLSGTSIAAPHATAIIARALAGSGAKPKRVLARLEAAARDLGEAGFDETYGFGRITAID